MIPRWLYRSANIGWTKKPHLSILFIPPQVGSEQLVICFVIWSKPLRFVYLKPWNALLTQEFLQNYANNSSTHCTSQLKVFYVFFRRSKILTIFLTIIHNWFPSGNKSNEDSTWSASTSKNVFCAFSCLLFSKQNRLNSFFCQISRSGIWYVTRSIREESIRNLL